MHRMGAQVHGLGANEPTCTPLATPLLLHVINNKTVVIFKICLKVVPRMCTWQSVCGLSPFTLAKQLNNAIKNM